jgi:lipopolysaccharide export system permease protein
MYTRMLQTLDRYILREISYPFAISLMVFTLLALLDRLYHLTDMVITKGVPLRMVASLLALMLPSFLILTLPIALLVATLLVCRRLAGDLEVVAAMASGVSPLRFFRPFLLAALIVTMVVGWLTLFVTRWTYPALQRQVVRILRARATSRISERTFNSSFPQFTMYVEEVKSPAGLKGLLISDERHPDRLRTIVARDGRFLGDEGNGSIRLRLSDGSICEDDLGSTQRSWYTTFDLMEIDLSLEPPNQAMAKLEQRRQDIPLLTSFRRPTPQLLEGQSRVPQDSSAPMVLEKHKRFALPLVCLVLVLAGYPMGIRLQWGGRGMALALSLGIALCYYILFTFLEWSAMNGQLPPGVAIWIPNVLFGLIGIALLWGENVGVLADCASRLWRFLTAHRSCYAAWDRRVAEYHRSKRERTKSRWPRSSRYLIPRYFAREYLRFLGLVLAVEAVFFFVMDLVQTFERFSDANFFFGHLLLHSIYHMPVALYEALPITVLLATVFLFLSLSTHGEIDALKFSGVNVQRVCLSVLLVAIFISLSGFVFQETFLPSLKRRIWWMDQKEGRGDTLLDSRDPSEKWSRTSDARFLRVARLDPIEESWDDLSIIEVDPQFRLQSRLDAHRAQRGSGGWKIFDTILCTVMPLKGSETQPPAFAMRNLPEHLGDLSHTGFPPDTMTSRELRVYIRQLQDRGHQTRKYLIELYAKLSFPLVPAVMVLVAIPLLLASPHGGSRRLGIGVAILIPICYWAIQSVALSFTRADLLPPLLGVWAANIIFGGFGVALLLRTPT